jgi:hypothetical protein
LDIFPRHFHQQTRVRVASDHDHKPQKRDTEARWSLPLNFCELRRNLFRDPGQALGVGQLLLAFWWPGWAKLRGRGSPGKQQLHLCPGCNGFPLFCWCCRAANG